MKKTAFFLAALFALSSSTNAAPSAAPVYGSFGIDLAARLPGTRPGAEFWAHANGGWAANSRVNGVPRNVDAWYRAFDVRPGDAPCLAPSRRIRIW